MEDLLNDGNTMPNIDELMKYIHKDGIVLSVDDILWREKYILPTAPDHSAIAESPPPLPPVDVHVLSTTSSAAPTTENYANPLMEELARRMSTATSPRDVIVIHRDALDDESPREEASVSLPAVSTGVVDNGVVVCDVNHDDVSLVDRDDACVDRG